MTAVCVLFVENYVEIDEILWKTMCKMIKKCILSDFCVENYVDSC